MMPPDCINPNCNDAELKAMISERKRCLKHANPLKIKNFTTIPGN